MERFVLVRGKKVTLDDVATAVGLSRFLVCRALTGQPGVNPETRQRIQETATRMGYRGRKTAPGPNHQNLSSVALLIDEAEANRVFWGKIISGIEAAARNAGCDLLLRAVTREEVERGEIPAMILEGRIKGVLITGNFIPEYVARFERIDCPVVLVDNYIPVTTHDAVLVADWEGSYQVTRYMIESGHRKLGYAGQTCGHWSWSQRFLGFLSALEDNGLKYDPRFAIGSKCGTEVWSSEFMNREVGRMKEMPTVWICNNDLTANYLIKSLNDLGLAVPEDISVTGFDNLAPDDSPRVPDLTTIRVFGSEIGKAAFDQLVWRLGNREAPPRRVMVGVRLIPGLTTASPHA